MFELKELKRYILKSALEAVLEAEETFASGEGAAKKQAAIAYIVKALPVHNLLKPIFARLLSKTIDCAIEAVVAFINAKEKEA